MMAGYEDYWDDDALLGVDSDEKFRQWKAVVDWNRSSQEAMAGTGFSGLIGSMAGAIADPTILLPGGAFVKAATTSARVVKTAASVGTATAAGIAVQEAGLQAVDPTRTFEESRDAVILGGVGGAVFGGAFGALAGSTKAAAKSGLSEALTGKKGVELRIDADGAPEFHKSAGAAAAGITDIEIQGLNKGLAKVVAAPTSFLGSVGQELVSPIVRGLTHPLPTIRKLTDELFQHDVAVTRSTASDMVSEAVGAKPSLQTQIEIDSIKFKEIDKSVTDLYNNYAGLSEDSFAGGARAFYRGKTQKGLMDYRTFDAEVAKAIRMGGEHSVPQVSNAAKIYIKEFDNFAQEFKALGMLEGEGLARYFPRRYNIKKILVERDAAIAARTTDNFTMTIAKHFQKQETGLDIEDAIRKAKITVARITRQDDAALEFQHMMDKFNVQGNGNFTKTRVLDIEDSLIEDYLDNSAADVFNQYAYQASAAIRYKKWLADKGEEGFADLVKGIEDDIDKMLREGKIKKGQSDKLRTKSQEFLTDSINSVLGRIVDRTQYNKKVPTALRMLRKSITQALLGGVTISSLGDAAMPIFKQGFRAIDDGYLDSLKEAGKALTKTIRDEKSEFLRKEYKAQARDIAAGWEMEESKLIRSILDPGEPTAATKTAAERALDASGQFFGRASLLAPWNNMMKRVAAHSYYNKTIRDLRRVSEGGKLGKNAQDRLSRLRLGDAEMQARILKQIDKHGENYDGSTITNLHLWDDIAAKESFQGAGITDVESTIITPGPGDIPFLMQKSEMAKTAMMFKSFMSAASNKITLFGAQRIARKDAQTAAGLLTLVAMGSMVEVIKDSMAGREPEWDANSIITSGMTRSGVLGMQYDMLFGAASAYAGTGAYSC
jgi:hypothetical protein